MPSKRKKKEVAMEQERQIFINIPQDQTFMDNRISTAKYNFITFIPKFLYEQFRKFWNVYFLMIGLLQQIPDVSPTGKFNTIMPLFAILTLTAVKEIVEDFQRHKDGNRINNRNVEVLQDGKWVKKKWHQVKIGDIVKVHNTDAFPADLILFSSSEEQGMCYIETSNLDGETNLKIRQSLLLTSSAKEPEDLYQLKGNLEYEVPNRSLYEFVGNIALKDKPEAPLGPSQVLLRGAKLLNTGWVTGLVIYTGHETKLLMNSTTTPLKRSNIDKMANFQIIFLFLMLILLSTISTIGMSLEDKTTEWYVGKDTTHFGLDFITFIILYNNLIPISLQVTIELVKMGQAFFISWDEKMHYQPDPDKEGTYAVARTSNLNEELGQIKYIFSDKTGTLTQNVMEYKNCSIAGVVYDDTEVDKMKREENNKDIIKEFLTHLAVCHTVIPEKGPEGKVEYNAASPDEKALVEGVMKYGFKFIDRNMDSITFEDWNGQQTKYIIKNVIEFTSSRKRMSIVIEMPDGSIKLLVKGADSVILERLGKGEAEKFRDVTENHLDKFAREGLRTLCMAVKNIKKADYMEWRKDWHKASTAIRNREAEIEKAAKLIEKDLTLIGATAIEDKLQDHVPETIANFLKAEIHVWVLTGDKQETAINIGHSCRLLTQDMPLIKINATEKEVVRSMINDQLSKLREEGRVGQENNISIIIDGKTLSFALEDDIKMEFVALCTSAKSVICCRVSPIQKAQVVELVQSYTGAISLSIGDGANDVAMIQAARVGIGISGNEGLQAANSADFAIGQFSYLQRLLFVHGAWNYLRISNTILFSFYKNIALYLIELWYQIYNGWSGQIAFESFTMVAMFNMAYLFLPPFALGLFDRQGSAEDRMSNPKLYLPTQRGEGFNHNKFWKWIWQAILHSVVLFWIPSIAMSIGVEWSTGRTDGYLVVGTVIYTSVVITTCLKAGLELDSWTSFSFGMVFGSIGLWIMFLAIFSYMFPIGFPFNTLAPVNMTAMVKLVMSSPLCWLLVFITPIIALAPDYVYRVLNKTFTPELVDKELNQ